MIIEGPLRILGWYYPWNIPCKVTLLMCSYIWVALVNLRFAILHIVDVDCISGYSLPLYYTEHAGLGTLLQRLS